MVKTGVLDKLETKAQATFSSCFKGAQNAHSSL